jgi:protein tyrosine/serine phosphatase
VNRRNVVFICSIAVLALLCIAALIGTSGSTHSIAEHPASLDENSAEVTAALPYFRRLNEHYTRGSQPIRGGVTVLARLGIKSLVDLRSAYDHTEDVGEAARQLGLAYYWLPMSVWDPPSDEQANEFLKLVGDHAKGPFFVFCADGLNRTGELSALHRIANDGWTVDKAIKEMDELGFNPYYYSLRQYVWDYARKNGR